MPQPALPMSQIAQLLDVSEDALRTLMVERRSAGDTTLVALAVAEAARRIGIGRTKLYEYVPSGEIASVKIGTAARCGSPPWNVPPLPPRWDARRGSSGCAPAAAS
ncbi:DNA-binding protein [Streptomyces sp. NPDC012637]|uniref:DNA-binding protein n=1 Tax=Streptomyces sp. NPDC012637 TaxID=3364842 RepID=UPI0036EFF3E1